MIRYDMMPIIACIKDRFAEVADSQSAALTEYPSGLIDSLQHMYMYRIIYLMLASTKRETYFLMMRTHLTYSNYSITMIFCA
jgi:hypothetical protein